MRFVHALYFVLAAVHIVAIVATGILWTLIDLLPQSPRGFVKIMRRQKDAARRQRTGLP